MRGQFAVVFDVDLSKRGGVPQFQHLHEKRLRENVRILLVWNVRSRVECDKRRLLKGVN